MRTTGWHLHAIVCVLSASMMLSSCRGKRAATPGAPVNVGYRESGIASWYGPPYHGRATASGEIYDMNQLTAAHRRLPFGLTARITNLDNQRTVDVQINDRGPFVKGRILDLSRAAAERLDMLRSGLAQVRLEVIRLASAPRHSWQAGAFRDPARANALASRLTQNRCPNTRVVTSVDPNGVSLYKVLVGESERASDLESFRRCLASDAPDARIVRENE